MGKDIELYVRSCPVCQVMKSDHRKKAGLLQPIPVPSRKWEQITTDLVTDLPPSDGHTAVAAFVDRLTKMVHFAPCTKEVTAAQYAQLFVDHVFKHHGAPEVIISDRDPRFTSRFWTQFFQILGTDLRLSTAFHPQTDGQSEVTIRVLENFLRPYVELRPSTWSKYLSLAEFAANNAVSVSTGYSPFYLNTGGNPVLPETMLLPPSVSNEAVRETISRMKVALEDAKTNLVTAQARMKKQGDKTRRSEIFSEGDKVYLSTRNLRTFGQHIPAKLRRRWVGPFTITKAISPVAYRLDLPLGWQIHPTFHVSSLKRYIRHPEFEREAEPPPPVLVDGDLEYEVETILWHRGKGARRRYLVMWRGHPLTEATWEPESNLANAPEILADYLRHVAQQRQGTRNREADVITEGADEDLPQARLASSGMGTDGDGPGLA